MDEKIAYSQVLLTRHPDGFDFISNRITTDTLWKNDIYLGFAALQLCRDRFDMAVYDFAASEYIQWVRVRDSSGEEDWDPVRNAHQAAIVLGEVVSDEPQRKLRLYEAVKAVFPEFINVPHRGDPL